MTECLVPTYYKNIRTNRQTENYMPTYYHIFDEYPDPGFPGFLQETWYYIWDRKSLHCNGPLTVTRHKMLLIRTT
jgi:hypothetical protein